MFASPRSLHAAFDLQASDTPHAAAVLAVGDPAATRHSYAEVAERSRALAPALAAAVRGRQGPGRGALPHGGSLLAVQLPRVHPDYVPLLLAASRCGLPFVLLSTDLPDQGRQAQRNRWVMQQLRPQALITGAACMGSQALKTAGGRGECSTPPLVLSVEELATQRALGGECSCNGSGGETDPILEVGPGDLLCLLFTGGTQRLKVAKCTHGMLLHERAAYPALVSLGGSGTEQPRVLGNASAFWPAAFLGQWSVSLAYGGCFVITENSDPLELRRVVRQQRVDVIGLVPDQLALLSSDPGRELPWVRLVISWAEKLPLHVARRWAGHPTAKLRELLISTEYWLSLCSEPLGPDPSIARLVPGARGIVLRLPEASEAQAEEGAREAAAPEPSGRCGDVGELCLAGPMVTPGYVDVDGMGPTAPPFVDVGGELYFRTGDLARIRPGGFEFLGRVDMLTKEKGQWVDMAEVESRLQGLDVVGEAKLVADPAAPSDYHAFVVLAAACGWGHGRADQAAALAANPDASVSCAHALQEVRAALPHRVRLHLIPALPRHCATRKVDTRQLHGMLGLGSLESWPISGATLAGVHAWGAGTPTPPPLLAQRLEEKVRRHGAWTAALLAAGLIGFCRPRELLAADARPLRAISLAPLGILTVPYMYLAVLYADEFCPLWRLYQEVPFGQFGCIMWLHLCGSCRPAQWLLGAWSLAGLSAAWWRGRPLSWIVVFWVGAGHQADLEASRWLDPGYWLRHLWWQLSRLSEAALLLGGAGKHGGGDADERNASAVSEAASASPTGSGAAAALGSPVGADVEVAGGAGCGITASSDLLDDAATQDPPTPTVPDSASEGLGGKDAEAVADGACPPPCVEADGYTEDELRKWSFDRWWWCHCTESVLEVSPEDHALAKAVLTGAAVSNEACCAALGGLGCGGAPAAAAGDTPAEAQRLLGLIEQVEPILHPVTLDSSLLGMDSLKLSLLASLVQVELGTQITGARIQGITTPRELLEALRADDATAAEAAGGEPQVAPAAPAESTCREYAAWWSPGQYKPMGSWVLRSDTPVDKRALLASTRWLVDRHSALRAVRADPLRLLSFVYDAATLATLYMPFARPCVRALVGWGFVRAWPRVAVRRRQEVFPGAADHVPCEVVGVSGGQECLEQAIRDRVWKFYDRPPFDVVLWELTLAVAGTWVVHDAPQAITIADAPPGCQAAGVANLLYRDPNYGHSGRLLGPCDDGWLPPPYDFAALFVVRLDDGGIVWLRFHLANELRLIWKPDARASTPWKRMWAERSTAGPDAGRTTTLSFLQVQIFHCYADGYCYYPAVGDLLDAYSHAVANSTSGDDAMPMPRRPRPAEAFEVLQGRLFDTLRGGIAAADRHSLRGSVWRCDAEGYSQYVSIQEDALATLTLSAVHFGLPLDYLLLALCALGTARASASERVEFTLYVPMRDGHEASMVGLFADWRDIAVAVPLDSATVLGVAVQVADILRQRRWTVYNALRKPERTVVNFMPLDPRRRGIFQQLPDQLWDRGDCLGLPCTRGEAMEATNQPLRFDLVQEHASSWCIRLKMDYAQHRPPWARRVIQAMQDAVLDLALRPGSLVHRPYPEDFY